MAIAPTANGMPILTDMRQTVIDRPKDPMKMFERMFEMMTDLQGRMNVPVGPPSDDYFADNAKKFAPNFTNGGEQVPSITVPNAEPKIYSHSIIPDPTRDRIFVYTGNYFYTTAPMLAVVLNVYGGVGTVLANLDQEQMAINAYLRNYATCPTLIKVMPEVVGTLRVGFFQNHPTNNTIIYTSYPLRIFVQNTQFQANIVNLPHGFKLGADVLMALPVPANTGSVLLLDIQPAQTAVVRNYN